jgi:predicted GIY-YIG superfamily endonuclease
MSFWAYILHCRGGYFYVGHTDNLEHRIAQHQTGRVAGFAADHRPAELVWSEYFQTRDQAKAIEKQLKGWSRAKKMALIRGDWNHVSALAKGKGSPSTSSGRTDFGSPFRLLPGQPELVEGLPLTCHPQTPSDVVTSLTVSIGRTAADVWQLTFIVTADVDLLKYPAASAPLRTDGLWRTTCFEAFFMHWHGPAYLELNLSPSSQWAAYSFASYRADNRRNTRLPFPPDIQIRVLRADHMVVAADLVLPPTLEPTHIALSAVIEETDGTKSYWALRHPPGPPDFHHPDCFALTLGAPDGA